MNEAQSEAVHHRGGPLLVLAGAGSGKTRVITERIASLVQSGIPPKAILAVSFTNKAAGEMAERLCALMPPKRASEVWLSTFHSFGVRFIREEAAEFGFAGRFVILDQGDAQGLLREIAHGIHHRKLDISAIMARISTWKNHFYAPDDVVEGNTEYDTVAKEVYGEYARTLRRMHAVDFDDLVVGPAMLLRNKPEVRKRWAKRFAHILVDEFQDTNRAQLELAKLLCSTPANICAVGDDDQSIYAWRGADIENILDFEQHFPGTTVVKLENNYRSTAPILDVANAVIAAAKRKRHPKQLKATKRAGRPVRSTVLEDNAKEAAFVRMEIRRLRKNGTQPRDIAVLYRSNLQARLIEEELRSDGQPYRMLGGTQFFERKEVKDAIAYLRAALNPFDELAFRRILNYPPRGIGDSSLGKLEYLAQQASVPLRKALGPFSELKDLPHAARQGAAHLHQQLTHAAKYLRANQNLAEQTRSFLEQVGLSRKFLDGQDAAQDKRGRYANIDSFLESLARHEKRGEQSKSSLDDLLQRLTLRDTDTEEDKGNKVTLSTLHAAKGLEFPCVFLIGCNEGTLPHSRTLDPKVTDMAGADIEEERRLFYVGITRAERDLYLTRIKQRSMRGRTQLLAPSRFMHDIPEKLLENYEAPETQVPDYDEVQDMIADILKQVSGATPSELS
ncbi:MAG: exodeoxyribonuclease V subunit gamma [Myxococcales bacterium]|nr:MAG: exodeoxyribonuclease V subunit gamma [Myxococcales bacterium]